MTDTTVPGFFWSAGAGERKRVAVSRVPYRAGGTDRGQHAVRLTSRSHAGIAARPGGHARRFVTPLASINAYSPLCIS